MVKVVTAPKREIDRGLQARQTGPQPGLRGQLLSLLAVWAVPLILGVTQHLTPPLRSAANPRHINRARPGHGVRTLKEGEQHL